MSGKIILITGPMFSGKTTEMIRYYKRYSIAGKKCLAVKYINDNRYDTDKVVSHDFDSIKAVSVRDLRDVNPTYYNVICIDEVQFFTDAADIVDMWAFDGKIVICSGLSGTFERKPWQVISDLIPKADEIVHLKAICRANGNEASFTYRHGTDKRDVVIGGQDIYDAVDREFLEDLNLHS